MARPSFAAVARLALVCAAIGVPVAVAWWWLTPPVRYAVRADGVYLANTLREPAVAADGWFAVCALVAGVLLGFLVALVGRGGDRLAQLLGLTAGGAIGAVVAWRLGVLLGPDTVPTEASVLAEGTRFDGPLQLRALGVLLLWPMAAVIVFFAAIAGLDAPPSRRAAVSDELEPSART